MSMTKKLLIVAVALILCCVAVQFHIDAGTGKKIVPQIGHDQGHAFTDADRAKIKALALAHLAHKKTDVVRVLHVSSHALRQGAETPENLNKHEAHALVFNYTTGKAQRVHIDPQTGKVTSSEEVKGFINSSHEEREEGKKLVESFKEHADIMKAGGLVDGGFRTVAPKGTPSTPVPHRYLEYHVTSKDHRLLRTVIVDLSAKKVISSKAV
jgi:hypothetical protein